MVLKWYFRIFDQYNRAGNSKTAILKKYLSMYVLLNCILSMCNGYFSQNSLILTKKIRQIVDSSHIRFEKNHSHVWQESIGKQISDDN